MIGANPIDKKVDLRGEVCPQTYVKAWLALEPLNKGQVLEILLDFPKSAEEVPKSLKNEGHEILAVDRSSEKEWKVTVRKN
ncbi:MAG: sulfurtransferase TusA family protein [Candidatus Micrarchaeia archaeon]